MTVHSTVLVSSSSILLMPDSSNLIKAMDDAIRGDLQSFSDSFFWLTLVSSAIVVIGVAFEGPELLHELWPKTFSIFAERWVKKIGMIGWLLVVLGVGGEVIFGLVENKAQGLLQTFNDILLADAQRQAGDARQSANDAADAAARAREQSDEASASSLKAIAQAQRARKEADSFERDIASANQKAADAMQEAADANVNLADARTQAANALEQLQRIKSPRALADFGALVSKLGAFKGTKFTLSVFQDSESIEFATVVNRTLHDAGWDRIPTPGKPGIYQIAIPAIDTKYGIPVCFDTGIQVHVRMYGTVYQLNESRYQPQVGNTASALERALASAIFPPNDDNVGKGISVDDDRAGGEQQPMNICVGKKP